MEQKAYSLFILVVLTSIHGWTAYPLLYVSTLLHEIGHYLGGRLSRLQRQYHITLGQGENRLSFHLLGASFSIGWIPGFENATRLQRLSFFSGGLLTNLVVSFLSFGLYHHLRGGLGLEDILALLSLPLLSALLLYNPASIPVHGLGWLAAALYTLGIVNSVLFWMTVLPMRSSSYSSDGVHIWDLVGEWLDKR